MGRFAPSPTGPLHFGSLYAALASYLDVVAQGGRWLIRVEDIDPPREVAGARADILKALKAHGLCSSEPVTYQSQRARQHQAALQQLRQNGHLFHCTCSRRELAQTPIYPGTCHARLEPPARPYSVRFRVPEGPDVCFEDGIHGLQQHPRSSLGDFIVRRRDGLIAYHLAVVADDAAQHITQILRGADLLDATPLHLCLQDALQIPSPEYLHVPMLTRNGAKLSKQTGAPAIDNQRATENLCRALELLGQPIPTLTHRHDVIGLLDSAARCWQRRLVPADQEIALAADLTR